MYGVITKALEIAHPSLRLGPQRNIFVFVIMQSVRPHHKAFERVGFCNGVNNIADFLTTILSGTAKEKQL